LVEEAFTFQVCEPFRKILNFLKRNIANSERGKINKEPGKVFCRAI
jgi:hypothetical protein